MRINNISKMSFKGYDAAPIKNLYMQGIQEPDVFKELKQATEQENINLWAFDNKNFTQELEKNHTHSGERWAQDDKCFIKNESKFDLKNIFKKEKTEKSPSKLIVYLKQYDKNFAKSLKDKFNTDYKYASTYLVGGNIFLGNYENGEKWMLVGNEGIPERAWELSYNTISKIYKVPANNIIVMNQPAFHLDMALRPVGYPYILVNDPELVEKNLEKYKDKLPENILKEYKETRENSKYAPCDETIKTLEAEGFIPIRIAGDYGFKKNGINYMNAIANKNQDGTISYITNSTRNTKYKILDKIFEKDLKEALEGKVELKNLHFISGEKVKNSEYDENSIMKNMRELSGGIHCMALEEPDFDVIA